MYRVCTVACVTTQAQQKVTSQFFLRRLRKITLKKNCMAQQKMTFQFFLRCCTTGPWALSSYRTCDDLVIMRWRHAMMHCEKKQIDVIPWSWRSAWMLLLNKGGIWCDWFRGGGNVELLWWASLSVQRTERLMHCGTRRFLKQLFSWQCWKVKRRHVWDWLWMFFAAAGLADQVLRQTSMTDRIGGTLFQSCCMDKTFHQQCPHDDVVVYWFSNKLGCACQKTPLCMQCCNRQAQGATSQCAVWWVQTTMGDILDQIICNAWCNITRLGLLKPSQSNWHLNLNAKWVIGEVFPKIGWGGGGMGGHQTWLERGHWHGQHGNDGLWSWIHDRHNVRMVKIKKWREVLQDTLTRHGMPASVDLLDMFHEHFVEQVEPPLGAHEIDASFGNLGKKHNMTIHFLKLKQQ